ncbi:MAG: hypothetical protein ABJ322_07295 [Marinobacter sp.]|uniref:hypothetical protein n=1 Tax=Marinobacter sp. TaxID=50741 RepID=UPI003296F831
MKIILGLVFVFSSSLVAAAECNRPAAPTLPDGDTAELQAMVDGQKAVKAYVTATEAYLDCLNSKSAEAGAEADPDAELARIEEHNAAVDEMEKIAGEFNDEIREYKAKAK